MTEGFVNVWLRRGEVFVSAMTWRTRSEADANARTVLGMHPWRLIYRLRVIPKVDKRDSTQHDIGW